MKKNEKKVSNRELLQIGAIIAMVAWFVFAMEVLSNTTWAAKIGKAGAWEWCLTLGAIIGAISGFLIQLMWRMGTISTKLANDRWRNTLIFLGIWTVAAIYWRFFIF